MKTTHMTALGLGILTLGVSTADVSAQYYDRGGIKNYVQNQDRFQNLTDAQKENFKKKGRKNYGFFRTWKQDITKTLEKIDNGVIVTFTTEKTELLEKIQKRVGEKQRGDVKIVIEKISNGIKITKTTGNQEILERMHKHADNKKIRKSITRNIENLDNGVKITITSDNADAIEKIKSREKKEPKNEKITKTVTGLSNGLVVTITSEDERTVERIQKRAERKGLHKKGRNFKKFGKQMHKGKRFNQNQE